MTVFFTTHYMEEAERIAHRIAIIDHGKIIAHGTSDELKTRTKATSLEQAFLTLTGTTIRAEEATSMDAMRMGRRMWTGRR
jgi:ABC-2 type transport system ATP-binding protein